MRSVGGSQPSVAAAGSAASVRSSSVLAVASAAALRASQVFQRVAVGPQCPAMAQYDRNQLQQWYEAQRNLLRPARCRRCPPGPPHRRRSPPPALRFASLDKDRSGTLDVMELQRALAMGQLNFSLKTVAVRRRAWLWVLAFAAADAE